MGSVLWCVREAGVVVVDGDHFQQAPEIFDAVDRVQLVQGRQPRGNHGGDGARQVQVLEAAFELAADGWAGVEGVAALEKSAWSLNTAMRSFTRVLTSSMSSSTRLREKSDLLGSGIRETQPNISSISTSASSNGSLPISVRP